MIAKWFVTVLEKEGTVFDLRMDKKSICPAKRVSMIIHF